MTVGAASFSSRHADAIEQPEKQVLPWAVGQQTKDDSTTGSDNLRGHRDEAVDEGPEVHAQDQLLLAFMSSPPPG